MGLRLLRWQKEECKVPKKILENILKITKKDETIVINEESYQAFCLLYVPDQILKGEIEIWRLLHNLS